MNSEWDFNDDFDPDEMAALADDARKAAREDELVESDCSLTREEKKAKRERELEAARAAIRLHPDAWQPPVLVVPPSRKRQDPVYRAYRDLNRPFRRAFGRGERHRKILLACGEANLKEKSCG